MISHDNQLNSAPKECRLSFSLTHTHSLFPVSLIPSLLLTSFTK